MTATSFGSWDETRYSIAVGALNDQIHTTLEAHAEAPGELLQPLRDCIVRLSELQLRLDNLGDRNL